MYGHGDPRKKQWWVFWDFFRLIYLKFGAEGAGNKETATDKDKKKKKEKKKKTPKAYPEMTSIIFCVPFQTLLLCIHRSCQCIQINFFDS